MKEKIRFHAEWSLLDFESAIAIPSKRFTHHDDYDSVTLNGGKMKATRLMNKDPDMDDVLYGPPRWVHWSGWSDIRDVIEHDGYVFVRRHSEFAAPVPYRNEGRIQGVLHLVWRARAAIREDNMLLELARKGIVNPKEL